MQSSTLATGITLSAPLYNAVAMVDVALNTSIITTTLLATSYRSSIRGDNKVLIDGFLLIAGKYKA